jgi:protein O-GlcNAc transferase
MSQTTIQQLFNSAQQLRRAGRLADAEVVYQQIIERAPQHAEALLCMGVLNAQAGRLEQAIDLIRRAIATRPDWPDAHVNLGTALNQGGQFDQAIESYRRALTLRPADAIALSNLGDALQSKGILDEAIASYRGAIALNPELSDTHYNLGNALIGTNEVDAAIASYRAALALRPNHVLALSNLGGALQSKGEVDEAVALLRQAIAIDPRMSAAHFSLGISLCKRGQLDAAIAVLRRAIDSNPGSQNGEGFINLLFALYHHPQSDSDLLLKETQRWAQRLPASAPADFGPQDKSPDRKLRIGYLSPFFHACADAHFIFPLLVHHDPTQVEIHCYSASAQHDDLTERVKRRCAQWCNISRLDRANAVQLIRSHEIDILVKISSPADGCSRIVASRLAPLQVAWLAFASCTTGLASVDYRISDPFIDPAGTEQLSYTEATVRLPDSAWCYDPLIDPPCVTSLPCLANGIVTFGSFNRFSKINPAVIAAWAGILRAAPRSRLKILAIAGGARQALVDRFAQLGVERNRILLLDRSPREKYLREYDGIDIMLDTFPFSGHTTLLDALWMGVPTVTCLGRATVGRAGASALHNIGLSQLIARTPQEYTQIAVRLASDLPWLTELRSTLRARMLASPLMDAPAFARNIESAYRQMWRRWCGLDPAAESL